MINSKELKPFRKRWLTEDCGCPEGDHHIHSRVMKVLRSIGRFFMFQIYYPVESFFRRTKERVGRSLAWARFTYLNYDFDSAFLYDVMSFKLKRLHKCLENGHAIQEEEDMNALKELIAICDRLHEGNYDDKYHEAHSQKWGELPHFETEEFKDEKGNTFHRWLHKERANVKTEEDKVQERKEFLECWEKGEADRQADIERMAVLLKNHAPKWWD